MTIQKVNTSRSVANRSTYVGEKGRLFYDEADGILYISDGRTPGGTLISGGGSYTLPTASSSVLGGVKIGSNITITAGVISVAAPFSGSYTDLTNQPTIPTNTNQLTNGAGFITSTNSLINGLYSATLDSSGNFTVPGNFTVSGNQTYIQGTNTVYTDNLIELHAPTGGVGGTWSSSDGKDIGLRLHYYSSGDKNAALVLAQDTGYLEWYSDGTETNGVFSGTYGDVKAATFRGTGLTVQGGTGTYYAARFQGSTGGDQFAIGLSSTAGYGAGNDVLNSGGTAYAPYTISASQMTFKVGSSVPATALSFDTSGNVTISNTLTVNANSTLNGTVQLGNTSGNYVQVSSAAAGTSPVISVVGVDSYPSLYLLAKSAPLILGTRAGTSGSFQVLDIGQAPVNILRVSGSTAGIPPSMSVSGTDPNIGMLFQTKGTGAFDIAAGSSGVNISNGGTVTAIVKVSDSLNYTSFPTSVTISNPTTAGGTAATAAVQYMYVLTPTIVSGGTGYSVNDVITFLGGTPRTTGATFNVSSIGALGAITGVTRNATGGFNDYTALPTNPVSVSVAPSGGSGATFNLNYGFAAITLLTGGSGYVETPTIVISGGGGTPGSFYATVGSGTIIRGIGSTSSFYTPSGEVLRLTSSGTNNTNYISIQGDGSGNTPTISSTQNLRFTTGGTASIIFSTNYSGQTELVVSHTALAVNYLQVTGGATGTGPTISSQGSDTGSINLNYVTKNTYASHIFSGAQGLQFQITGPANGTYSSNRFVVYSSATGSSPVFGVTGADANIDVNIQPRGTGSVNITGNLTLNGGGAVSTINKLQTQSFGGF